MLNEVDVAKCVEFLDDDGKGIDSDLLEHYHNQWDWATDEPETPLWKIVVKGQNIVFIFHHSMCDGMGGVIFHREFLAALNSMPDIDLEAQDLPDTRIVSNVDTKLPRVPAAGMASMSFFEKIFLIIMLFLAGIKIKLLVSFFKQHLPFRDLPPSEAAYRSSTKIELPEKTTHTRITSYRVEASRMSRIIRACRENGTTFTPLFTTVMLMTLANDFYKDATLGCTRIAIDLRPELEASKIGGGTDAGVMFNGTGGCINHHWFAPYRRVMGEEGEKGTPMDRNAVWDLVRQYKTLIKKEMGHKLTINAFISELGPPDLEDVVEKMLPSMGDHVSQSTLISNIGAFTNPKSESEKPLEWAVDDMQFSMGTMNGTIGTHGLNFVIGGVKGGDTTINVGYEEGVVTRDFSRDVIEAVMAKIDTLICKE